ncbi:hypothetical protein AURDEDRAFT_161659 [Auricularia subglabra TFB-10046 SS5]|nr:hypothetical protein AURDEDRAFT_161659 [Auricularia subglabra TFB-10046 SS5]
MLKVVQGDTAVKEHFGSGIGLGKSVPTCPQIQRPWALYEAYHTIKLCIPVKIRYFDRCQGMRNGGDMGRQWYIEQEKILQCRRRMGVEQGRYRLKVWRCLSNYNL